MLYHRTILEPPRRIRSRAETHYIVLKVQKTAFGLDIIPESLLPQLIQKGRHVGDFRKMKKFNQTPYKLPPPTPIHVPAEKRPSEENALPKKRVRITPVMRHSRCPRTCADSTCPTITCADSRCPRICADSKCPTITCEYSTTTCADSRCLRATCADSTTTCTDSRCPRTCADSTTTCADSRCPRATCADSTCPTITCADSKYSRTCAASSVTSPTVTCADSTYADSTCAYSRCSTTCADSSVTSPTATYADSPRTYEHSTCIRTCADSRCSRTCADSVSQVPRPPMQILHVSEPVQIPVSQVPQPPMQILHVSEPVQILHVSEPVQIPVSQVPQPPMQILHVSEPVQIPVSQVPQSPVHIPPVQSLPEPMQLLPELYILDPLESTDAFDQLMSFIFGPQELQLLHTVPSIFDGDVFSFLDEFEREPMDLRMPRLNSCVKKSIGFKPFQPMDLSVNSCIGQ
ncbi:uncharacterized protein TNCV_3207751 [Trichonephila clavipes]|nr:uncharacterized protein TNCV_3207751 [Trichonephila clavipes]